MATEINKNRRCVIIAGAPCADAAFIRAVVLPDDYIICADRGYQTAVEAEITPDLLIGDFDSYGGGLPSGVEIIRLNPEKDNTDTLHCVKTALERGMTEFVLLAATGGRLDHTLANLSVTEYLADRGAHCIILSKNEKIELLTAGIHTYSGCKGLTFSVFPYGCKSIVLSYTGAYYPLNHGVLTHSTAMGVSNVFTDDTAEITVHEGKALLIINLNKEI